jgi:hypothetical protein
MGRVEEFLSLAFSRLDTTSRWILVKFFQNFVALGLACPEDVRIDNSIESIRPFNLPFRSLCVLIRLN